MDKAIVALVLPWSADSPAGVSVVVRNLMQHMDRRRSSPVIVVSDWGYPRPRPGEDGALWFRFAVLGGDVNKAEPKQWLAALPRLYRTWRLLSSLKVQAVNFHYPSLQAIGVALLKRSGLYRGRLILSFHGSDVVRPRAGRETRLWRLLFEQADAVTACSRHLADRLTQELGIPESRIKVIHNGVDAGVFHPAAGPVPLPAALPDRYVISVGGYVPLKGHRVALAAFASIAQEFPSLKLVIAGMDGPERPWLREEAVRLDIGDRLVCLVDLPREAVAFALSRAQAAVQPSHREAFGMAVIEAGACGVPVAASAVGGHMEVLRPGDTGLLFPADEAAACANALRHLLLDRPAALAMAERFRKEVGQIYTWQACADAYLSLTRD